MAVGDRGGPEECVSHAQDDGRLAGLDDWLNDMPADRLRPFTIIAPTRAAWGSRDRTR